MNSRPNGANGTHAVDHDSHLSIPCAPLGRGISAAKHSRVSPFAITADPVGDENSIVSLIVEMIEPYQGRVYDPAMGSGGFQSVRPKGASDDSPGQRPGNHPTTWRLAAMNMAKSLPRQSETATGGIDFGKEPADTFTRDQHPDLRADFVMALPSAAARSLSRSHSADRPNGRINPPFNIKEWWDGKLEGDARWKYGTPPPGMHHPCFPRQHASPLRFHCHRCQRFVRQLAQLRFHHAP